MRMACLLAVLPSSLALACVSQAPDVPRAPETAATPDAQSSQEPAEAPRAAARQETEPATTELTGNLVPAEAAAIALWPEAWSGELLVLEVLAQGSVVREGDVLARLDTEKIAEAIEDAELDLRSARVRHEGLLAKQALEEQAAAASLEQARARLDRARRALAGYKQSELAFDRRSDELRTQREQYYVEDQLDELAQLEAMYEADELVDATEEIVLKRSRRDLKATRLSNELSSDRRRYGDEVTQPLQTEAREEDVALQTRALERLEKSQTIDARARQDAGLRSAVELEKKQRRLDELLRDAELFEISAPRDGVLLHGKLRDYRPGGSPPRLERGSRLSMRSDVLLVADPTRLALALDVPERSVALLEPGARLEVRPLARPELRLEGELSLEAFPEPRGGGKDGAVFAGTLVLPPGDHGLVFGMHAEVEIPAPAKDAP